MRFSLSCGSVPLCTYSFRKQIANFRPPQVILEVEGAKKDKAGLVEMMRKKRQRDDKIVKQQLMKKRLANGEKVLEVGSGVVHGVTSAAAGYAKDEGSEDDHGGHDDDHDDDDSDSDGGGSRDSHSGTDNSDDDDDDDVDSDADTVPATRSPGGAAATQQLPKYMRKALAAGKKPKVMSFRDESQYISATPGFDKSDVSAVEPTAVPVAFASCAG